MLSVVGLDYLLLDASPCADIQALRLSPGADLRDVIPSASPAPPLPGPAGWRRYKPALYGAALGDKRLECFVEALDVLLRQVDLVFLAIDRIVEGLRRFRSVEVICE